MVHLILARLTLINTNFKVHCLKLQKCVYSNDHMRVDNCQQSSSFVFTSKDGKKTRSKEKRDSAANRNTGPSPLDNKRTQSYGHCRGVTAGISVGWFSKGITAFFYYVTSVLLVLVKNPFFKTEKDTVFMKLLKNISLKCSNWVFHT